MKRIVVAALLSMSILSVGQAAPPPRKTAVTKALQNFDFVDMDLCVVIKQLAKIMGRNVYIDPGVEGRVTIHLKNVSAQQALTLILKQQKGDFSYIFAEPNTIVVAPVTKLNSISDDIMGGRNLGPSVRHRAAPSPLIASRSTLRAAPIAGIGAQGHPQANSENYQSPPENGYFDPRIRPLSTFSIDVDTASYANIRRFLTQGQVPPPEAVRLEELVNYFVYDYASPPDSQPVAVNTELGNCPWDPKHTLLRVGLQGKVVPSNETPPRNLVFLIDVSGSMGVSNKLPLLKQSLKLLVDQLRPEDTVAIVVYAGASGTALPSTKGSEKSVILEKLLSLEAGGSTNGADGIKLAYQLAQANFDPHGINRVILCTDGDFNVGITSQGDLQRLIEDKRSQGIYLSVLGYGMGNLKDATMEMLADKGNGNYAYIDSLFEARKVLVEQAGGTLIPVAKDVKVQVEFNPAWVGGYRLLGYENRILRDQDFNNDKIDAGELGSGQSVTALYELAPPGEAVAGSTDPLKFQTPADVLPSNELAQVKVRYKLPQSTPRQPVSWNSTTGGSSNVKPDNSSNVKPDNSSNNKPGDSSNNKPEGSSNESPESSIHKGDDSSEDRADNAAEKSLLLSQTVSRESRPFEECSDSFRFAAAVAAFANNLRHSRLAPTTEMSTILSWARNSCGSDAQGYRADFLKLIQMAQSVQSPTRDKQASSNIKD